ncbi:MAG: AAA family ATPase, partial [Elusimicrobiota bacterium]
MKRLIAVFISLIIPLQSVFAGQENQSFLTRRIDNFAYINAAKTSALRMKKFVRMRGDSPLPGRPHIYLLEDIHLNKEAQENLAESLKILTEENPTLTLGIEGSYGPFNYTPYRKAASPTTILNAAKNLLNEGRIGAASLAGLTLPHLLLKKLIIKGVESANLYSAHVDTYRKAMENEKEVQHEINLIETDLSKEASQYSTPIQSFLSLRKSFDHGQINMGDYLSTLIKKIPADDVPLSVETFLSAYQLEKRIPFQKAKQERDIILAKLTSVLSTNDQKTLLEVTQALQTHKIQQSALYEFLQALFSKYHLSLSKTPSFQSFIQYILLVDLIEPTEVMSNLFKIEQSFIKQIISNKKEKDFVSKNLWFGLLKKLITFSLTPEEWEQYKRYSSSPNVLIGDLDSRLKISGMTLKSFENFYHVAEKRNPVMLKNLGQNKMSALLVGGFHTAGLVELIKKQGTTVSILTPRISKIKTNSGTEALRYFLQEKSTLQKLFSGRKLFLGLPEGIGPIEPQKDAPTLRKDAPKLFYRLVNHVSQNNRFIRELKWGVAYTSLILISMSLSHFLKVHAPLWIMIAVVSVVLHELAHGWAAIYFGDRTPRDQGRLTLNFFSHWNNVREVIQSDQPIVKKIFSLLSAKPIEFKDENARVSIYLAGPALNIALASLGLLAQRIWGESLFLEMIISVNLVIALYNLLLGDGVQAAILAYQKLQKTGPPYKGLRGFSWQRFIPFRLSLSPDEKAQITKDIEDYRKTTLSLFQHIMSRDNKSFQIAVERAIELAKKIRIEVRSFEELKTLINKDNAKRLWPSHPEAKIPPVRAGEIWIAGNTEGLSEKMRSEITKAVDNLFDSFPENQKEDIKPFKNQFRINTINGNTIFIPDEIESMIKNNEPIEKMIAQLTLSLTLPNDKLIPDHLPLNKPHLEVSMQPREDVTLSREIAMHETVHGLSLRNVLQLPSSSEFAPMAVSMLELLRSVKPDAERFSIHEEIGGVRLLERAKAFAQANEPGKNISSGTDFENLQLIVGGFIIENWSDFDFESKEKAALTWMRGRQYAERKLGAFIGMVFHYWYSKQETSDSNPFPALRHLIEYANSGLAALYAEHNFEPIFMDKAREKKLTQYLTEEIQSLTGIAKLLVQPWKAKSPEDKQPQWRFTPELEGRPAIFEYPLRDFFNPDEEITKLQGLTQARVVLQQMKTTFINEENVDTLFQLLWGTAQTLIIEKDLIKQRPGLIETFERMVLNKYPNPKNPAAKTYMEKQPGIIQYLEGIMFQIRKGEPDPRVSDISAQKIKDSLNDWNELLDQETIKLQARQNVQDKHQMDPDRNPDLVEKEKISISLKIIREKIWPVLKEIFEADKKNFPDQNELDKAAQNMAQQLGGAGQQANQNSQAQQQMNQQFQNLKDMLEALGNEVPDIKDLAKKVAELAKQLGEKAKALPQEGNGNRPKTAHTMKDLAQQLAALAKLMANKTKQFSQGIQKTTENMKGSNNANQNATEMENAANQANQLSDQIAEAAKSLLDEIKKGTGEDTTGTQAKSQGIDGQSNQISDKANEVGDKADKAAELLQQLAEALSPTTNPGKPDGEDGKDSANKGEPQQGDLDSDLLKTLEDFGNKPGTPGSGGAGKGNSAQDWAERLEVSPQWAEHWMELRQAAMPLAQTLKNKWSPYFDALITEGKEGRQISGKKLDPDNVVGVFIDGKALERTSAPESLTVALELVLDVSGSMGGPFTNEGKLDFDSPLVQTAVAFIAQALAFIELNRSGKWRGLLNLNVGIRGYAAYANILILKAGQKITEKELAKSIEKLFSSRIDRAGTADAPTLKEASKDLKERTKGERAITLVIHGTDGNVASARPAVQDVFDDPSNKNIFYFTAGVGGGDTVKKTIEAVYKTDTNPHVFWSHANNPDELRTELTNNTTEMIKKASRKLRKAHDLSAPLLIFGSLTGLFSNGFLPPSLLLITIAILFVLTLNMLPPNSSNAQNNNDEKPPYEFENTSEITYFTLQDKFGQKVRLPVRNDTNKTLFTHKGIEWELERHRLSIKRPGNIPEIYGEWLGDRWVWYEQQTDGTVSGLGNGPPAELGLVLNENDIKVNDESGKEIFSGSLISPQVWGWKIDSSITTTQKFEKNVPSVQQVFKNGKLIPNQIRLTVEGQSRIITLTPTFLNQLADMMEVLSRPDPASTNLALTGDKSTGKNTAVYVLAAFLRQPVRTMSLHEDINEIDLLWKTTVGLFKPGTTDLFLSEYADSARVGDWIAVDEATKPRRIGALTALNTVNQNRRLRLPNGSVIKAGDHFRAFFLWNPPNGIYAGQSLDNVSDFLSRLSGVPFVYPSAVEQTKMYMAKILGSDSNITYKELEIPLSNQTALNPTTSKEKILVRNQNLKEEKNYQVTATKKLENPIFEKITLQLFNIAAAITAHANSNIGRNAGIPPMDPRQVKRTLDHIYAFPNDLAYVRDILLMDYPIFLLEESEQAGLKTKFDELCNQFLGGADKFNKHYLDQKEDPTIDPEWPRLNIKTITENGVTTKKRTIVFGNHQNGVPEFEIEQGNLPLSEAEVLEFLDTPTNRLDLYNMAKTIYLGFHYAVIGEKGTGKTESILYLYKGLLRQPLVQPPQITESMQGDDILGTQQIVDAKSHFPKTPLETALTDDLPINFSEFTKAKQSVMAALNNVMEYGFQTFAGGRTARAKAQGRKFHMVFDGNPATGSTQSNALSAEFSSRVRIFQRRPLNLKQLKSLIFTDQIRLKKEAIDNGFEWTDLTEETITALAQSQLNLLEAYRKSELGSPPDYRQIHRLIQNFGRYPLRLLEAESEYIREMIITDPDHERIALQAVRPMAQTRLQFYAKRRAKILNHSDDLGKSLGELFAGIESEIKTNGKHLFPEQKNETIDKVLEALTDESLKLLKEEDTTKLIIDKLGITDNDQKAAVTKWIKESQLHNSVSKQAKAFTIFTLQSEIEAKGIAENVHSQISTALKKLAPALVDLLINKTINALPTPEQISKLVNAFNPESIQDTLKKEINVITVIIKALDLVRNGTATVALNDAITKVSLYEIARKTYPKPQEPELGDISHWLSSVLGSEFAQTIIPLLIEMISLKMIDKETIRELFSETQLEKEKATATPTLFNWDNYTAKNADSISGFPRNGDPIPGLPDKTWNILSDLQLSPEGTKGWVWVVLDGKDQILECDRDLTTGALSNPKPLIKDGEPIPGMSGKTWNIQSNLQLSPEGTKVWVWVFLDDKHQILEC